jgi:hypothetical protein
MKPRVVLPRAAGNASRSRRESRTARLVYAVTDFTINGKDSVCGKSADLKATRQYGTLRSNLSDRRLQEVRRAYREDAPAGLQARDVLREVPAFPSAFFRKRSRIRGRVRVSDVAVTSSAAETPGSKGGYFIGPFSV